MAASLWRTFIRKPRLNNYISAATEVGYSHYGPTFAVAGTLSAQNSIVLVHNICTEISDKDGKNSHYMDWFAFRPAQQLMGNFSEIGLTMASKFTITPEKSYDYNILFIDNGRFSEMKPLLKAIKDAWEEALIIAAKEERSISPETLFAEFKELKLVTDATERLRTIGYWEPGEYVVRMRVTTQNPKQIFDTKRFFVISETDAKILADNAPHIIANICQQTQAIYSCATPLLTEK